MVVGEGSGVCIAYKIQLLYSCQTRGVEAKWEEAVYQSTVNYKLEPTHQKENALTGQSIQKQIINAGNALKW